VPVDTNHDWGGDMDWLHGESGCKLRWFCSRVIFLLFYCHFFAGKKALSQFVRTMRTMTTVSQAGNSDIFAVVLFSRFFFASFICREVAYIPTMTKVGLAGNSDIFAEVEFSHFFHVNYRQGG